MKEWLSGRKQRVCISGCKSSWRTVSSRVPQGSVLGPVLFLIFINYLKPNSQNILGQFYDILHMYAKKAAKPRPAQPNRLRRQWLFIYHVSYA